MAKTETIGKPFRREPSPNDDHQPNLNVELSVFNYEMYNLGLAQVPSYNAILEADTWWPIASSNLTPWFSATGHSLTSVLSLTARDRGAMTFEWKNTRNKKIKVRRSAINTISSSRTTGLAS